MTTSAGIRWNFAACRERIRSLQGRLGFSDAPVLSILDLRLSLEDGTITAGPDDTPCPDIGPALFCLLDRYAQSREVPATFSPMPFEKAHGSSAYAAAFWRRAVLPLGQLWGTSPGRAQEIMDSFGAVSVAFAHRAWILLPLPRVPVYLLFWDGDDEIPASANLLFDTSVPAYLETEQMAMLGELVTDRIVSCARR